MKNFGFKKGAIASSVAHDSHNIICVGVSDEDIKRAVNLVIENAGGIAAACSEFMECLPLPVAGLMSGKDGFEVAKKYRQLDSLAKTLGTGMQAPFMVHFIHCLFSYCHMKFIVTPVFTHFRMHHVLVYCGKFICQK